MTDIYTWSTTAADNDDADSGINWAEFQDPDTVNNSARQMMARVASWRDDLLPKRTSAGSTNAYTVTANAAPTTLTSDFVVWFKADRSNTGSSTLTVNGLPAKPLRAKSGTALAPGDIQAGTVIGAYYALATDEYLIVNSGYHFNALSSTIASAYAVGLKVGMWVDFGGATLPAGFLWADGSAVSRTTYAELFAAYGTTYGAGDGSTTFNLPNLKGRTTFGRDDMGGTAANRITNANSGIVGTSLGAAGGGETVTLTRANLPNTTVAVTVIITDPGHRHTYGNAGGTTGRGTGSATAADDDNGVTTFETTGITATGSFNLNGSVTQTSVNKMPPALICNKIILALPAAANAAALGTNGVPYVFDDGVAASDPGAGTLRLNNATLASATAMYISETGANAEALGDWLSSIYASSSNPKGQIHFYKIGAVGTFAIFDVTAGVDSGAYRTLTISHVASTGTFTDNDRLSVLFYRKGDAGPVGPSGGGVPWTFDNVTTDSDPGAGNLRANNAALASATQLFISTTDGNTADQTAFLDAWDDSTSTVKGVLQIAETSNPANFALYNITSVTTATGYRKIGITHISSNGTLADNASLSLTFNRTGDKGDTGSAGADGGIRYHFDVSTTTAADPGSGDFRLNNATLASVTEISLSYACGESGNPSIETFVKSWDDSTTLGNRGTLILKKISAPQNYAIYSITSAITDGTTYGRFTLSHLVSAGSFADTDMMSVQFLRTGDKGTDGLGAGDVVGPSSSVDGELALFNGTTGKLIKRASTSGLLKAASGVVSAAASGTDYAPATSGSALLKGNGAGGFSSAVAATDYCPAPSGSSMLKASSGSAVAATDGTDFLSQSTGIKQGKHAYWVPATQLLPRVTNGPEMAWTELATNKIAMPTLDFDTTTEEGAGCWIYMPKSYNAGTVTFKPIWTAGSGSGGVVFSLAGRALADDDAIDAALGTAQTSTDTLITANDMHEGPESSAITIAGTPAGQRPVYFELKRVVANGSDTLGVDAKLLGFFLFMTLNAATDA